MRGAQPRQEIIWGDSFNSGNCDCDDVRSWGGSQLHARHQENYQSTFDILNPCPENPAENDQPWQGETDASQGVGHMTSVHHVTKARSERASGASRG
jgi:hypothetical protein